MQGRRGAGRRQARPDLGPFFYEPTVLADVTADMELCRDETFGPVVAVYRFASVDETVVRANDTEYGLNASVWTRDVKAGREIAERVEAGTVNVNDGYASGWASAARWAAGSSPAWAAATAATGWSSTRSRRPSRWSTCSTSARRRFCSHGQYAAVMTKAVSLLKHVPGIK